MAGYHGGQVVKEGFYLKHSTWELESVSKRNRILPGNEDTCYSRVPLPVIMIGGPLSGSAYVIAVPFLFCLTMPYIVARWMVFNLTRVVWRMLKVTE